MGDYRHSEPELYRRSGEFKRAEPDYAQFGMSHETWRNLQDLRHGPPDRRRDGLHTIGRGAGRIDLLALNGGLRQTDSPALIVMNGAISDRSSKSGPFFSGRGLAATLGVPTICVADTLVTDHADLNLGWYRGEWKSGFASLLEDVVGWLSGDLHSEVVIVGGSAGAFAAMDILQRVRKRVTVLGWNPQVDFLDYVPGAVDLFLRRSLLAPPTQLATIGSDVWKAETADALSQYGVRHDLVKTISSATAAGRFILLQNANDWHLSKHFGRLIRSRHARRIVPDGIDWSDNQIFRLRDYGQGHIPPRASDIVSLLRRLLADPSRPVFEVFASELRLGTLETHDSRQLPQWLLEDREEISRRFNVAVETDGMLHSALDPPLRLNPRELTVNYRLHDGSTLIKSTMAHLGSPFPLHRHPTWSTIDILLQDRFGNLVDRRRLRREDPFE